MSLIQMRMRRFLFVDSFSMIALAAFTAMIAVESFLLTYSGWFVTWSCIWFFQNVISTVQIQAFSVPICKNPSLASIKMSARSFSF